MHGLLATHTCTDLLACMRAGTHTSIHEWMLPSLLRRRTSIARFSRSATYASIHACILLACMHAGTHTSIHEWLLPSLLRRRGSVARFSRSATHRFTHARRHAYSIHLPRHLMRRVKHRFTHARRHADSIHLPRRFAFRVMHSRIDSRIDAVCKQSKA